MSTEEEKEKAVADKASKEKALDTAMKLGTQCSRTVDNIIESSNMIYKFLSDKKEK